jgi:hypothetical protein
MKSAYKVYRYLGLVIVSTVVFVACETTHVTDPLPHKVIGDWLVVSEQQKSSSNLVVEDDNGLVSYWSETVGWVGNIELCKNGTLNIGHLWNPDLPPNGTWKLNQNSIVFFTEQEVYGTTRRDTLQFNVSINESQQLVLDNDFLLVRLRKLD